MPADLMISKETARKLCIYFSVVTYSTSTSRILNFQLIKEVQHNRKQGAAQAAITRKAKSCFNSDTGLSKAITCVRVDGASDEGQSH